MSINVIHNFTIHNSFPLPLLPSSSYSETSVASILRETTGVAFYQTIRTTPAQNRAHDCKHNCSLIMKKTIACQTKRIFSDIKIHNEQI